MKGRKPIPAELKRITGNPGRRPIFNGIEADPDIPECPVHLSEPAKEEWARISYELNELRLVSRPDRAALAAYCQAWARWAESELMLQQEGIVIKAPSGYPIQNPWLAVANKAMEQMKAFLTEFGMTPSSRTRVHVQPKRTENRFSRLKTLRGKSA